MAGSVANAVLTQIVRDRRVVAMPDVCYSVVQVREAGSAVARGSANRAIDPPPAPCERDRERLLRPFTRPSGVGSPADDEPRHGIRSSRTPTGVSAACVIARHREGCLPSQDPRPAAAVACLLRSLSPVAFAGARLQTRTSSSASALGSATRATHVQPFHGQDRSAPAILAWTLPRRPIVVPGLPSSHRGDQAPRSHRGRGA